MNAPKATLIAGLFAATFLLSSWRTACGGAAGGEFSAQTPDASGRSATAGRIRLASPPDSQPPQVISAWLDIVTRKVTVTFSEEVTEASATVVSHYAVSDGVQLSAPQFGADRRSVALSASNVPKGATSLLITVSGVRDLSGNAMVPTNLPLLLVVEEKFGLDAGTFTVFANNRADGNNFGFSNTGNASGERGELGGSFARSVRAYAAVPNLGGSVSQTMPIMFKGQLLLQNKNFDGGMFIGYARNLTSLGGVLGINLMEPGGGFQPAFRGQVVAFGATTPTFGIPNGQVVSFELRWDPVEGRVAGYVGDVAIDMVSGQGNSTSEAVLVGAFGSNSNPALVTDLFLDNLTYTVASVFDPSGCTPFVALEKPTTGQEFLAGAPIELRASAYSSPCQITKVEFFVTPVAGGELTKLGEATTAPYTYAWLGAAPGDYLLKAVATDDRGNTSTSAEVGIKVVSGTVRTKTVTETFDTDLGTFNVTIKNQENGNSIDWAATSDAGGTPGELAGMVVRTSTADAAFVATDNLGGVLKPSQHNLRWRGKLRLINYAFDGNFFIGYYNSNVSSWMFGLWVMEPGGGMAPNFRGSFVAPGYDSGAIVPLPPDTPFEFDLLWDATLQTLSGTVAGREIKLAIPVSPAEFDRFGLVVTGTPNTDPWLQGEVHLDDVSYTAIGMPSRTEHFDTDLGSFKAIKNNGVNGNSFGFSNTNNAGGEPGEAGGLFSRTTSDSAAYMGDAELNGQVTLADPLVMKGRLHLADVNADGNLFIGFIDTSNLGRRLGIDITEPGGGIAPNFRGRLSAVGAQTGIFPIPPNTSLSFDLAWDPASGTLSGTVGTQTVSLTAGPGTTAFDAFIVGAFGAGSNDPTRQMRAFVDDLTYSIASEVPPVLVTVKLTAPAAGTVLPAGSSLTISADATALQSTVAKVEFFATAKPGGAVVKIGEDSTFPYEVVWSNVPVGDYDITAQATGATGATATSDPVAIQVMRIGVTTTITETFDSSLGRFDLAIRNRENGNDFGFSNTANAGGAAGEAGGTLVRTSNAEVAYIGEAMSGGVLYPALQNLVLKGRFILRNYDFDGEVFIGYVNTQNVSSRLGLVIREPGGGFAPAFRGNVVVAGAWSTTLPLEADTVHSFDLKWDAASHTWSGTIAGQPMDFSSSPGSINFDAFIFGAFGASSSDPTRGVECYVDELSYTIIAAAGAPALRIGATAGQVEIRWTQPGFLLQSRSSFGPGSGWQDSNLPVVEEGGSFKVIVPASGAAQFFRLISKP